MKVVLYSTNCPKCQVLEKKLNASGVDFEVCGDTDLMQEKGFQSLPMLEVDGETMDFMSAVNWANKKMGN